MSPEMKSGQWTSMRSTPPKISLSDFDASKSGAKQQVLDRPHPMLTPGLISVEAEHFSKKNDRDGFGWQIIRGLGKTGDSVSVFPNTAKTFTNLSTGSPSLEYPITVDETADFTADFYLLPTQPLVAGGGLRIAFSVNGIEPQIVTVDKNTEVSSAKWARNILNEVTIGTTKIHLEKGPHILRIFAVDTGVVLDKIVLHAGEIPVSYFGLPETLVH